MRQEEWVGNKRNWGVSGETGVEDGACLKKWNIVKQATGEWQNVSHFVLLFTVASEKTIEELLTETQFLLSCWL